MNKTDYIEKVNFRGIGVRSLILIQNQRPDPLECVYTYIGGNPINWIDPYGLEVAIPYTGVSTATGLSGIIRALGPVGAAIGGLFPSDMADGTLPWDATPIPEFSENQNDRWIDDPQATAEYDWYKAQCKGPLPPSGDECQDYRNLQHQAELCASLRSQWDERWMPGRHDLEIMKELKRARKYKKLADECEKKRCK